MLSSICIYSTSASKCVLRGSTGVDWVSEWVNGCKSESKTLSPRAQAPCLYSHTSIIIAPNVGKCLAEISWGVEGREQNPNHLLLPSQKSFGAYTFGSLWGSLAVNQTLPLSCYMLEGITHHLEPLSKMEFNAGNTPNMGKGRETGFGAN